MNLGQYYTPLQTGVSVTQYITGHDVRSICDIGAGRGDLLYAASQRWKDAHILASDIDQENVKYSQTRLPKAKCLHIDALRYDLPNLLGIEEGSIDVMLGNPPYGSLDSTTDHISILKSVELYGSLPNKRITKDIIFLAQNLRLLKHKGEMVIILPDGIATNHIYQELRSALIEKYGLWRVQELPTKLFRGTEAKTAAFFLKKGDFSHTTLLESSTGKQVQVNYTKASQRMDATYHLNTFDNKVTLADLKPEILRGALTFQQSHRIESPTFHTTSFKHHIDGEIHLSNTTTDFSDRYIVSTGDILIPRVGSRCLHYVGQVKSGSALFSDCVYRIRVDKEHRERLLKALKSPLGIKYRQTASHGTCAASLSKKDLLLFPLEFDTFKNS